MKILLISKEGDGVDSALRLTREGHDVRVYVEDPKAKEQLDGLVTKVPDWRAHRKVDLVVFDDSGIEGINREVQRWGVPAFGMGHANKDFKYKGTSFHGSMVQEALESQRTFAQGLMKDLGCGNPIESLQFHDVEDAIEHLKEHPVAHVIKPEVHGSGSEKTYVGELEDGRDAIGWLETLHLRPNAGKIKSIEVEERVRGVEVAVSGWFNGKRFVGALNINFEHKKLAHGDLGFNTGEMGTLMFYDPRPYSEVKLFQETLAKVEEFLAAVDYRGQLDINCIVNEAGVWPLEFTPRLGYPSSYIEDELQLTPLGEMLYNLGSGSDARPQFHLDRWAMGVVLVGEGYPFWDEGKKRSGGMPIIGLGPDNLDHLHLCEAHLKEDRVLCTGCYPLIATGTGEDVFATQRFVYDTVIPQVFFPGMYYRKDIGDRVPEKLEKLTAWGYPQYLKR